MAAEIAPASPYTGSNPFPGRLGTVQVFDLIGHAKAKRAYAWMFKESGKNKVVTVLKIPPVDSPQTAVKVAIAAKARQ